MMYFFDTIDINFVFGVKFAMEEDLLKPLILTLTILINIGRRIQK